MTENQEINQLAREIEGAIVRMQRELSSAQTAISRLRGTTAAAWIESEAQPETEWGKRFGLSMTRLAIEHAAASVAFGKLNAVLHTMPDNGSAEAH